MDKVKHHAQNVSDVSEQSWLEHSLEWGLFEWGILHTTPVMLKPTRNLGFQLSLFQPGGADYAHYTTACPPKFDNLMTSLHYKTYLPRFVSPD